jgi:serine/threonine protein kinase
MDERSGKQVGNYRLIRLLGRGGFAEVYLGRHVYLNTEAAIKMLRVQLVGNEEEHFLNEARMIASLVHPNIVRVLDYGIQDQAPFLVMDYAPHGTLRQRHPRGTQVPLLTVVSYLRQIAEGLHYAHGKKLIHRDIKPENLLLGASDEVLLGDFGTALTIQNTHDENLHEMAGTITYMAPEQIRGKPQPASDQYGLAVIVYEWLCGQTPFQGSFNELFSQHMFVTPPSLREKIPMISLEIEQVVMTALSKEPEKRFGSVKAFANAFTQASLAGEPTIMGPITAPIPMINPYTPLPPVHTPSTPLLTPSSSSQPLRTPHRPLEGESTIQMPSRAGSTGEPIIAPAAESIAALPTLTPTTTPRPVSISTPTPSSVASGGQKKQGVSRRAVILGAAGVVAVGLVGGSVALTYFRKQTPTSVQRPTPVPGNGRQAVNYIVYIYNGHARPVNAVSWSPDSTRIASGSGDRTVQVWDAASGNQHFRYNHTLAVKAVAWSPDGRYIASAGRDNVVQVHDAAHGRLIYTYRGHAKWVNALAWSPDSSRIASGSHDNTVQVWNALSGDNVLVYRGHSNEVHAVTWSPDGKEIASGSADHSVQVWQADSGKLITSYKRHNGEVNAVGWSPDGTKLVSGSADGTVQIWQAATGIHLLTYQFPASVVNTVAWSPDGTKIVSGGALNIVEVWEAASGNQLITYRGHSGHIQSVAWSPDGKYIASGSADMTVRIWRTPS